MKKKNNNLDLLEFLKYILSCMYISDLKIEPYNTKAKLLLKKMDLRQYSTNQIIDAVVYIFTKK